MTMRRPIDELGHQIDVCRGLLFHDSSPSDQKEPGTRKLPRIAAYEGSGSVFGSVWALVILDPRSIVSVQFLDRCPGQRELFEADSSRPPAKVMKWVITK